jgi:PAS domain S-box-containing protein
MNLPPAQFALIISAAASAAALLTYFLSRKGLSKTLKGLDDIFDAVPDIVLLVDTEYTVLKANRKALQTLGLTEREALGRKCYYLLHNAKAPHANCPCAKSRLDHKSHTTELADALPGKLAAATSLPILDEKGALTAALHIIKDVSDQKKIENRDIQYGKMEALGRLAGGLAHEFNNILSIISSASYMLQDHLDKSDAANANEAAIRKAVASASSITRHLLTLSQRQILRLKPMDLNNLIQESMRITRKLLGEATQIETDLEKDLCPVLGDSVQLNRLLTTILSHADPDCGAKRKITLKTENLIRNNLSARTPNAAPANQAFVKLRLKDTACAIKKESLDHVFEPYFEARNMNLAVAYGIAHQHDGWIDAVWDKTGVTFEIYLPAAAESGPQAEEQTAAAKSPTQKTLRILLAEDDEDLRVLTARALSKNGHQVSCADCVEKAFEVFDAQKGNFDTLISDVVMPDKSGVDLADGISKIKPGINVILMSGYIDDKIQLDAIQRKGYKFIYKPFDIDALLTILRF